jgi:hypothetical protein
MYIFNRNNNRFVRRLQGHYQAVVSVFILLIIGIVIFLVTWQASPIPSGIAKQINYVIFYPQTTSALQIKSSSIKYDRSIKQLSFIASFGGSTLTFSEQSTPDAFNIGLNYYNEFVQNLGDYDTFSAIDGTVSLTRPTGLSQETAVMNAKGTLMFVKSSKNLDEDSWKLLFNSFKFIQPS